MPTCSLNEIEAYARRAARGAGMSWGLADEAGRATRWLTERGVPGAALLAALLERNDGYDYASLAPVTDGGRWQANGGRLCPVCTGATLSDRAATLAAQHPLLLGPTTTPMLLAPFLAQATPIAGSGFELCWEGARVRVGQRSMTVSGDDDRLWHTAQTDGITITRCKPVQGNTNATGGAAPVDDAVWRRLTTMAHRTYVPASEASRARGAGAGTSDND